MYKNRQLMRLNKVLHKGEVQTVDCISPGNVTFVEDIKGGKYYGEWADLDEVEFIPLTEEWLEKLGFTTDGRHHTVCYDLGLLSIEVPNKLYSSGRAYFNSWCILNEMPKHVHQLQNLYFALTGEELTIKN